MKNILSSAVLYSNDIPAAVGFYRDVIGLEISFVDGERYAELKFDNGLFLSIKKASEEREVPGHQTFFMDVQNVEERYEEMKEKEVTFKKELTTESFGVHFSIFDPDRNKVEFMRKG